MATAKRKTPTPEPPKPDVVAGTLLADLLDRQERLRAMKREAEAMEKQLKLDAAPVIQMLKAGAQAEPGWLVSIKTDTRRNVKWAEEFVKRCGEAEAERLRTECVPSVTESLVIARQSGGLTIPVAGK